MIHHQRSLNIQATPTEIWAVIGRFMHIDKFAPLVTSVDALTEGKNGIGSKRRCHFEDGTSIAEEVIEWQDNQKYRVRLSEFTTMPLHQSEAEIEIEVVNNHQSKVIWSMDYRVKYGILGWLLGQTMMKMMMTKILDANLKGLAEKIKSH